jgi:hypothetical protein
VVLGARNVQMSAPGLIAEALRAAGSPEADVLVAAGHGRSYGEWSRMMGRGLPGIVDCGLWPALEARRADGGGIAVVTDIGNDLAYGVSGARLAGWVETCVGRLREHGLRVAVSRFPAPSVASLGWLRFELLRALLFPGRRFSLASVLAEGAELNARLERSVAASGAAWVPLAPEIYGLDRIHWRRAGRALAWDALTAPVRAGGSPAPNPDVRLRGARAELRTLFGRERRCAQPCVRLASGSTVSFF